MLLAAALAQPATPALADPPAPPAVTPPRPAPPPREMTVTEVQRAVIRAAQLEPERTASLMARARRAAALPRVHVGLTRELRRYDTLTAATDPKSNAGAELLFEVSATWSLDRLVFHPGEVAAARQAVRASRARRELVELATRLYFTRRRLTVELSRTPDGPARQDLVLRREEATALLEGLMGQKLARTPGGD
jgi:hypothetical protein